MTKERGEIGLREKIIQDEKLRSQDCFSGGGYTFFNTGLRNKVEIYFRAKAGASRMKNEGVMTVLVGEMTMLKRGGKQG